MPSEPVPTQLGALWEPSPSELRQAIVDGERWFATHGLSLPPVDIGNGIATQIPYRSALEVAAGTSEHPDWLVPGFVALQAITELDGKVKTAGKTTWATHMVAAILDGERFMGYPTTRTNVVYLTEQTQGSFREALARAGLIARGAELRLVFRREISAIKWVDLIATVAEDALRDGYGLLVVDTVGKMAGLMEENAAGEGAAMMVPLQNAAHDGMAVLVCRHERKTGGEVGESGRGSSAISGDVDVILQLRRPEGNQPANRRVIESLSRYSETPEKIVVELTEEGYILLGDEEAVTMADALRFVSGVLNEFDQKQGCTIDELLEAQEDVSGQTRLERSAIRRALHELVFRGEVQQSGLGKRGSPFRFALSEVSVQTPSPFRGTKGIARRNWDVDE